MDTIQVDIVSAEGEIFSGPASMVFLPASEGEIGVAPRHAPLLTLLKAGEVRVRTPEGEEHLFFVGGGALEIQPKKVTVLADTAARARDLDEVSFSNTGSTDLRDTDVQQPNTTATLSFSSNSAAFSANSGQLEAGSTTTASSFLPSSPPFLFCSSIIIRTVSLSVVSLMAMVPESECSTPTLMVSAAEASPAASVNAAGSAHFLSFLTFMILISNCLIEAYICSCSFKPNSFGEVSAISSFWFR